MVYGAVELVQVAGKYVATRVHNTPQDSPVWRNLQSLQSSLCVLSSPAVLYLVVFSKPHDRNLL